MALNFPASPSTGDIHNASNNLSYFFDGVKWITQGSYNTGTINAIKLDSLTSSFNGSLTTFNLTSNSISVKPANTLSVMISLGGVIQEPTTAYSLNSETGTITFASAPASNTAFFGIVYSRLPQLITTVDDGTITNAKVSTTAAIDKSKLDISDATTSVSGFMSTSDKTKLDGIEASATADQTNAEIRAAVEAATDSNVFTDADHTKLNGIEAHAINASNAAITNKLPLAGGTITGDVTFTGDSANIVFDKSDNALEFADNAKVTFGADADLQLFHDGSKSVILDNGTGGLVLRGENTISLGDTTGNRVYLQAIKDGAVSLRHNNIVRCETSANGLDLPDNSKLQLGDSQDFEIYHSGNHSFIRDVGVGNLYIDSNQINFRAGSGQSLATFTSGGANELYHNGTLKFYTDPSGVRIVGDLVAVNQIYLPDSTSTSIGRLSLGADLDGYVYHDGSNYYIENATGNLLLRPKTGEEGIKLIPDGAVELYHDGTKKVETSAGGLDLPDNSRLRFGNSQDLQIYHDSNNSFIQNTSSNKLKISADEVEIVNSANSEFLAKFVADAGVQLYHNNVKKAETTSSGITVTGSVTTQDMNMSNLNGTANEVDNTKGSWSIQEGADDLFLINRVSGKKYKFNLTEIT
jgi:hypothetical protein